MQLPVPRLQHLVGQGWVGPGNLHLDAVPPEILPQVASSAHRSSQGLVEADGPWLPKSRTCPAGPVACIRGGTSCPQTRCGQ